MIHKAVTITNRLGLHARAAAKFVSKASTFESDIRLIKGAQEANGKSIMSVMMLAASKGTELVLCASGGDEEEAIGHLENLVNERFGEAD